MAFRVTHANWLKVETDRVQGILFMRRNNKKTWTSQSLRNYLEKAAYIHYTLPEIEEINDELHKNGIVEDVGGP